MAARDVRRARLELVGHVVERRVAQMNLADHLAATHERRHLLEDLASRPQRAGAWGPECLVAGEDEEVGVQVLDADRLVGHGLRAIDQHQRAHLVRLGDHLFDRVDRADAVRHGCEGDQLGLGAQQDLVALLDQPPLFVERDELEVGVLLLGQHLPRDEVGVMLQLGQTIVSALA